MSPRKRRNPNSSLQSSKKNTKGKGETNSDKAATKKLKSESKDLNFKEVLDFTSPKSLFESFINPIDFNEFFEKYWEKQPIHISRGKMPDYVSYLSELFSLETLRNLLKKESLRFGYDLNVVRYVDKVRKDLNLNGNMTVAKLDRLFNKEKGTVQFHQPQRFQDELWHLLEKLECFFGCLVGANVYITPPGAQGLPPHHDDVEVFIVQIEGEKHWQLHKPLIELPREYSRDLTAEEIGEPAHNIILKPGDLLYFPRGTIHHARTLADDGHSTHITVSTYQRHTWADYLMYVLPKMVEDAIEKDKSFRKGLPINFMATGNQSEKLQRESMNNVELLLSKMKCDKYIAAQEMMEDFTRSRLPPYKVDRQAYRKDIPDGPPPDLASKVRLRFADRVCCIVKPDWAKMENDPSSSSDEESDDTHILPKQKDPEMLFVLTSFLNDRRNHMMGQAVDDEVFCVPKFAKKFTEAVNFLKSQSDRFVDVSQIPLDDTDKVTLIRSLWATHLLEVETNMDATFY